MTTSTERQPRVLIVEDDILLAKMWRAKLTHEECQVLENYDGANVLEQAVKECPDLILLDVGLTKDDGFSILRSLREAKATKNIPVILITKLTGAEDVQTAVTAGAQEYLMKPNLNFKTVIAAVKEYVFHDVKPVKDSGQQLCGGCQEPLFPGGHYCSHCGIKAR
jgi:DNA-binding response OmpR family regulator